MKVLSLFDGISCGMVALERAKIPVERYVAYEIDENAIKISKKNYPQIEHCGDVTTADFTQYKDFDLLIGGSPCTYWSIAKDCRKRETTPNGIGGQLFMQFVRALRGSRPKYFLYENNSSINPTIKVFISEKLKVNPIKIDSALLSAQHRERLYWTNINFDIPCDKKIMLNDVVDFSDETRFKPVSKWVYSYWGEKQKIDSIPRIIDKKARTLTTSKTHSFQYYLHTDKKRYTNLTVGEWEALQTLPKGYVDDVETKETAKYKAIGNGWTVDVIAHILKGISSEV